MGSVRSERTNFCHWLIQPREKTRAVHQSLYSNKLVTTSKEKVGHIHQERAIWLGEDRFFLFLIQADGVFFFISRDDEDEHSIRPLRTTSSSNSRLMAALQCTA